MAQQNQCIFHFNSLRAICFSLVNRISLLVRCILQKTTTKDGSCKELHLKNTLAKSIVGPVSKILHQTNFPNFTHSVLHRGFEYPLLF